MEKYPVPAPMSATVIWGFKLRSAITCFTHSSTGSVAVSTTSPSLALAGLAPLTTYGYASVQNNANGDSNVVTVGPITTASALAFSGTIPTQNVTSGQSVDIDLSSYFSGTGFGTLSYASIGTSLTGSGLSLNTSTGHITGTAGSAQTVSGVQVRKGDSGSPASQASSNTFNIVIGAAGAGPTINTQPTTQTAKVGAAATWTMAATSSHRATFSFQGSTGLIPRHSAEIRASAATPVRRST